MITANDDLSQWQDLIYFQANIAQRWLERGKNTGDIFAKFFFYFAGFNALYYLWQKVDDFKKEDGTKYSEDKQIEHLLEKIPEANAVEILQIIQGQVSYFINRRPIQRMDKRKAASPASGDPAEGKKARKALEEASTPSESLKALGGILYLVRSNLVHGGKQDNGDDQEVIDCCIVPLEALLQASIELTLQSGNPNS
jgi:hypothetical protein